jgi:hypothetical protein
VTSTALQTALQSSYMADGLSTFAIFTGAALLLVGIGFAIIVAGGVLRNRELAFGFGSKREQAPVSPTPVAQS